MHDMSGALRDLVPCAQFKKREKHPWRSNTFSKAAGFSLKVTPLPWVFFTFFKSYEWYQIAQSTTCKKYTIKLSRKKHITSAILNTST